MKISISNYRPFGPETQSFEIDTGFTAFVGPNNSGKSSITRISYEFRNYWHFLSDTQNIFNIENNRGVNLSFSYLNGTDNADSFHRFSNSAIQIQFEEKGDGLNFTISQSGRINLESITKHGKIFQLPMSEVRQHHGNDFRGYKIFDNSLIYNLELEKFCSFFKDLSQSIYIPSHRNIVNKGEGREQYYDILTGTNFIKNWLNYKNEGTNAQKKKIATITEDIQKIFGFDSLEIDASLSKNTLHLSIDREPFTLSELGSGLSEFILVLATAAMSSPTYIFIDEPEVHLHAALQQEFLFRLSKYSKKGVVYSTHSLGLAQIAERIYTVVKTGTQSFIKKYIPSTNFTELLGEFHVSIFKQGGIEKIFLVEGPTDIPLFRSILNKFNLEKFIFLPLGGDGLIGKNNNVKQGLEEILKFGYQVVTFIDSEKPDAATPPKKERKEFISLCTELGIKAQLSGRRASDNYLTQRAIDEAYPGKGYRELGEYGVRDNGGYWPKSNNWVIAEKMTKEEFSEMDLGDFIKKI